VQEYVGQGWDAALIESTLTEKRSGRKRNERPTVEVRPAAAERILANELGREVLRPVARVEDERLELVRLVPQRLDGIPRADKTVRSIADRSLRRTSPGGRAGCRTSR
jgi:hypothetical protein